MKILLYNDSIPIEIGNFFGGDSNVKKTYQYHSVMRMKKAAEMLLTEDLTIAEVAYSVGINDPFYFSKCFKNQFGVSPSAYRKKLSEDENEPINDADV